MGMSRFVTYHRRWCCWYQLGLACASCDVPATEIWCRARTAAWFGLGRYNCQDLDPTARIGALVCDAVIGLRSRRKMFHNEGDTDQRPLFPQVERCLG